MKSAVHKASVHRPIRTCVGCRKTDAKGALLRFVAADAGVCLDTEQRLPGRGAYVHPVQACVKQAAQSGFSRSFRSTRRVAHGQLWAQVVSNFPTDFDLSLNVRARNE
jgi:predicted RNA-binding protein YlxR (DUF448 family)